MRPLPPTTTPTCRPRAPQAAILRQRPVVLTQSIARHASTIAGLSSTLDLPLFNVAVLVAGHPALLGMSPDRIRARWQRLKELIEWHPPWKKQLVRVGRGS